MWNILLEEWGIEKLCSLCGTVGYACLYCLLCVEKTYATSTAKVHVKTSHFDLPPVSTDCD